MFQLANQSLKISVCYLRGVGAQRRLISMACNCRSFLKAKPLLLSQSPSDKFILRISISTARIFWGVPFKIFGVYSLFFVKVLPLVSLWPLRTWIRTFLERNTSSLRSCYLVYVNFAVETILSTSLSKQDWLIERVNINIRWNKFALNVDFQ